LRNKFKYSYTERSTILRSSLFPSFVLVCPSNCGSGKFTLIIAVNPSLTSFPLNEGSLLLSKLFFLAKLFTALVKAVLKPVK